MRVIGCHEPHPSRDAGQRAGGLVPLHGGCGHPVPCRVKPDVAAVFPVLCEGLTLEAGEDAAHVAELGATGRSLGHWDPARRIGPGLRGEDLPGAAIERARSPDWRLDAGGQRRQRQNRERGEARHGRLPPPGQAS
ncbi:hypothetical protein Rumeso_00968 [Rubellimicrobium mesophilum DSM 19309]|uniref:Uncharacterized protein n=1 Tax=Rubellimicrobium mesophilum DSM 19309 TaxID=442562 RepID=A0A017HUI4_9RHOB|nr:hypothetical protein Rumeso_00968 [Rubellimicrobium mesophilum DSM 19309]